MCITIYTPNLIYYFYERIDSMLRNKGLTDKVIILGLDGMDPRFSKAMVDEG